MSDLKPTTTLTGWSCSFCSAALLFEGEKSVCLGCGRRSVDFPGEQRGPNTWAAPEHAELPPQVCPSPQEAWDELKREAVEPQDPTKEVLIVSPGMAKAMKEALALLDAPGGLGTEPVWRCGWCGSTLVLDPAHSRCPGCK